MIVSDRQANAERVPVPMLLAIGAVRRHLMDHGLRLRVGLVAEAGDAWDIHHFATLIGYGAELVYPWLALRSVGTMVEGKAADGTNGADKADGCRRYRTAAEKGLLKIMSKMGISVLPSYCGAQIFEALGLGAEVIDRCFRDTTSALGGLGFDELAEDALARHRQAWSPEPSRSVPDHGRIRFRKEGEDHGWAPPIVVALQKTVRAESGEREGKYQEFLNKNALRPPAGPRDLLTFRESSPVPLEQVEPVESILRRFVSSAMSLGALSPEAHSTISIAMNRMGARSNSGEGGEDPAFYSPLPNGDRADNRGEAGGLRAIWRDHRVPDPCRGVGDQDRPGCEAG